MRREDKILLNLPKYDFIKEYLQKIVNQRLLVRGYTFGVLTAQLLDGEDSQLDLKRLDNALRLGKEYCTDFKNIFKERALPFKDRLIDKEIINILAEIKAFEVMYNHSFSNITKVKRTQEKTVDFTAIRNEYNYAIEVIRLGLTQSKSKEPEYLMDVGNRHFSLKMIGGADSIPIFRNIIRSALVSKYPQIEEFCQRKGNEWKGILFISTGRDYFIANRYAQNLFNLTPKATSTALMLEWDSLKNNSGYDYLKHIIITMGKDSDEVIVYPEL